MSPNDHATMNDIHSRLGAVEATLKHGEKSREMMRHEMRRSVQKMTEAIDAQNELIGSLSGVHRRLDDIGKRLEVVEEVTDDYKRAKTKGIGVAAGFGLSAGAVSGWNWDALTSAIRRIFGG